jgi:hypothetical protein
LVPKVVDRVDFAQGRIAVHSSPFARPVEGFVESQRQVVVGRERLGLDIEIVPNEETITECAADVNGDSFHGNKPL